MQEKSECTEAPIHNVYGVHNDRNWVHHFHCLPFRDMALLSLLPIGLFPPWPLMEGKSQGISLLTHLVRGISLLTHLVRGISLLTHVNCQVQQLIVCWAKQTFLHYHYHDILAHVGLAQILKIHNVINFMH